MKNISNKNKCFIVFLCGAILSSSFDYLIMSFIGYDKYVSYLEKIDIFSGTWLGWLIVILIIIIIVSKIIDSYGGQK